MCNVLYLGPSNERLIQSIEASGCRVIVVDDKLTEGMPFLQKSDWLVSYRYRHIIPSSIVKQFNERAINLHISFLPWNRGADPNLWSFIEQTPKGVSIHYIDEGIDTGALIARQRVFFKSTETLASSYEALNRKLEALFMKVWPVLIEGKMRSFPQRGSGSVHYKKDRNKVWSLLSKGWETKLEDLPVRREG